jgi:uncharacterized membrane protein
MIKVQTSVVISRSPKAVFAYISNFENNPRWQGGIKEARFTSHGPLGVGSTYAQVATFLGRRVESTFEVIDYQPNRLVKATSTSGSFPITFTRIVEPVDHGTKVSAIVEGDATGFFKLAQPLLARMVQKSVDADYTNLKQILEAQA